MRFTKVLHASNHAGSMHLLQVVVPVNQYIRVRSRRSEIRQNVTTMKKNKKNVRTGALEFHTCNLRQEKMRRRRRSMGGGKLSQTGLGLGRRKLR